jgi:hypothetical protein
LEFTLVASFLMVADKANLPVENKKASLVEVQNERCFFSER